MVPIGGESFQVGVDRIPFMAVHPQEFAHLFGQSGKRSIQFCSEVGMVPLMSIQGVSLGWFDFDKLSRGNPLFNVNRPNV